MRRWGVSDDLRRSQVVDEIRASAVDGVIRVRGNEALYAAARRAFGSWSAALEEAGVRPSRGRSGPAPGDGAYDLVKHLDVIADIQVRGLPVFMRDRQILGGYLLNVIAGDAWFVSHGFEEYLERNIPGLMPFWRQAIASMVEGGNPIDS